MKKTYIVSAKVTQYHRQGVEADSPAEALAMLRGWKHWGDDTFIETDSIELDPDPDVIEEDEE
jgi:site-specific recombinase XerC